MSTETFDEENPVVTQSEFRQNDEKIVTEWGDDEVVNELAVDMAKLSIVRISYNTKLPKAVIDMAVEDVLRSVNWPDYAEFKKCVTNIVSKNFAGIKYASVVTDVETKKQDFWLIKGFINLRTENAYEHEGVRYLKSEVLTNTSFFERFNVFCEKEFNNEFVFRVLHGSRLDVSRFSQYDWRDLTKFMGVPKNEITAETMVMIQFKKPTKKVMIGAKQ